MSTATTRLRPVSGKAGAHGKGAAGKGLSIAGGDGTLEINTHTLCRNCKAEPIFSDPEDEDSEYATGIFFDPGGTTGWCVMQVHPAALADNSYAVLDNVVHWAQGEIVGPEPHVVHEMATLAYAWPGAAIVVEDFILATSRSDRETLSPVRLTAGLDYALWLQDRVSYRQSASAAKNTVTDARLKAWGYYERTGGLEHARDATRHALLWWRECRGPGPKAIARRHAAWPHLFDANGACVSEVDAAADADDVG